MININGGYNEEIKTRSVLLNEYAKFVDVIHRYQERFPIQEAVKKAIEECIENGILKEFLEKERDAVMSSILYEYDEEETLAYIAEEQYGLGHDKGKIEGKIEERILLINKKIRKSKSVEEIADDLECELSEIREIYNLIIDCGVDCDIDMMIKRLASKVK